MNITALIVDDWAVMRKLVIQTLSETPFKPAKIFEATDGVDALQKLQEKHGINLILSDWNMPHMDGITFVKKVREKDKTAVIVMITTENSMGKIADAMKEGANAYLVKPFTKEEMQRKLEQAFAGKTP